MGFSKFLPYTKSAALFPPSLLCTLGCVAILLQIPWQVIKQVQKCSKQTIRLVNLEMLMSKYLVKRVCMVGYFDRPNHIHV